MNTENRKTNKPHKFVPNFLQRLDLRNLKSMLLLKTDIFIARGEILRNNIKTRNSK